MEPSTVAQLVADEAVFAHICRTRTMVVAYAQALTAWRNAARDGTQLGDFPKAPQIDPPPPGAVAGIFTRAGKLAHRIKVLPGYTSTIGAQLGLIAPAKHPVDLSAAKPELEVTASPGQPPVIRWRKGRMGMLAIHVSREGAPFVLLQMCSRNFWTDTSPLPPAGMAQVWRYKAIFVDSGNQQLLGQWSNEVSVAVSG